MQGVACRDPAAPPHWAARTLKTQPTRRRRGDDERAPPKPGQPLNSPTHQPWTPRPSPTTAGPELESPVFTVCTLNVGGRNTNSFEFEMRGDLTELFEQWGQQFGECLLGGVGACTVPRAGASRRRGLRPDGLGTEKHGKCRYIIAERCDVGTSSGESHARLSHALQRLQFGVAAGGATGSTGNAENLLLGNAKFEANVEDDSVAQFFGAWLRWLHSTSDQDWAAWSKRAKKYATPRIVR